MTFLASLLLAAGGSPGVTIVLPHRADVFGTEIVVGEIADVLSDDVVLARAVETTAIGYAPAPGYSRLLQNHQIGLELQKAFPDVTWTFKGQVATRVWPVVYTVPSQELEAAALAEVEAAASGLDADYVLSSPIADLRVPGVQSGVSLRGALELAQLTTGGLTVPVQVLLDGQVYRTINTTWNVKVWQQLPVVGRPVIAGEPLSPSLFETRRVLLDGRTKSKPVALDLIAGATAARALRTGQVVTEADVHRPVAVRSGDVIFIEVAKGAVTARVVGTALASGALRDRVIVRLDASGREMLGTVVSPELVRVELGLHGR